MGRGFFFWLTSPFPSLIIADNFDYLLTCFSAVLYEKEMFLVFLQLLLNNYL